ncbi:SpoIIE family protein phosphatase [Streptomyces sp. NPDC007905]
MATEQLGPGDRLLPYTDGIVEARDAGGRRSRAARPVAAER